VPSLVPSFRGYKAVIVVGFALLATFLYALSTRSPDFNVVKIGEVTFRIPAAAYSDVERCWGNGPNCMMYASERSLPTLAPFKSKEEQQAAANENAEAHIGIISVSRLDRTIVAQSIPALGAGQIPGPLLVGQSFHGNSLDQPQDYEVRFSVPANLLVVTPDRTEPKRAGAYTEFYYERDDATLAPVMACDVAQPEPFCLISVRLGPSAFGWVRFSKDRISDWAKIRSTAQAVFQTYISR
jgi:hypothetical protein